MVFQRRRVTGDSERRIQQLQVEALQSTVPGEASVPLNQAGDLLLRAGDVRGALDMYGRAVDSLVEADRFEAAMGLCKKIIRTVPDVVRARCTLAWLAIGAGFTGDLSLRVGEYVEAAQRAGRDRLAREHLRRMGAIVEMHDLRLMLADYLLQLGDARAADELFGSVFEERNTGRSRTIDTDRLWADVRSGALRGPAGAASAD